MSVHIAIIGLAGEENTGRKIGNLLSFAGAESQEWTWLSADADREQVMKALADENTSLIVSAAAWIRIEGALPGAAGFSANRRQSSRVRLVYGFTEASPAALRSDQKSRLNFSNDKSLWGPLAGASVSFQSGLSFFIPVLPAEGTETLAKVADKPLLVRLSDGTRTTYLLGTESVPDLAAPVRERVPGDLAAVTPWLACLREILKGGSWRNDHPRACLIIDDPLLKEPYGCLSYKTLLEKARSSRFCASIAFIPWNCRRTKRDISRLFRQNPNLFSLSVHGCDHTAGEFATVDLGQATSLAATALNRMEKHERLQGLPFDKTMVFPQGLFSTVAMEALKSSGYLAAINTSLFPTDAHEPLTLRELLEPAVTRFSNLPLFGRRYPERADESALDLFFGKPAFLVEHHGYFRDHAAHLADYVTALNAFEPNLEWISPAAICTRTSVRRTSATGDIQMRFFCDYFHLQNTADSACRYVMFRKRLPDEQVAGVTVGGRAVGYEQTSDAVQIVVHAEARASLEVRIIRPALGKVPPCRSGFSTRVFLRRHLSELRDNYIHTSPMLWRMNARLRGLRARHNGRA